jgi:hypothetical protein
MPTRLIWRRELIASRQVNSACGTCLSDQEHETKGARTKEETMDPMIIEAIANDRIRESHERAARGREIRAAKAARRRERALTWAAECSPELLRRRVPQQRVQLGQYGHGVD